MTRPPLPEQPDSSGAPDLGLPDFGASGPGIGSMVGGRYELLRPIASGGMARVWEARDSILNRPVAVKILHPHLATDRGFLLRFRREAIAAARLSHRSIISIYDTVSESSSASEPGETSESAGISGTGGTIGTEAIVMELIRGNTLRATLDRVGRLSPMDTVELGLQVADALDEAHRSGIVHRDIKPSNILFCSDRRIMVTDFGIAKAGEDTDLTVTGTLLGTAKYLSPEQVNGDEVDPRADLYSLGIMLFEVLTGRVPFQADTDAATALARLHQAPPRASQIQPDIPADLDSIIHRLMARQPENRFPSAADLSAALSGVRPEFVDPNHTLVLATNDNDFGPSIEEDEEEEESFLRSERSWMLPTMALVLVAAGLLVAGVLISRSSIGQSVIESAGIGDGQAGGESESSSTSQTSEPGQATTILSPIEVVVEPSIVGAQSLDFQGDGEENPHQIGLGFDGDDNTSWNTETYHGPLFGRLKTGVAYLVDLGGKAEVSNIRLETNSRDWSISFFLLDDFVADPAAWGEPIAVATDESGNERFRVDGVGHYLLLWITDPGTSDDGSDEDEEDDHRFELAEIEIS